MHDKLYLEKEMTGLPGFFSGYPNVLAVFLFGSYDTGYQTALSDIDFAVLFDQNTQLSDEMELTARLSRILNTDRVDLINLRKAPLRLQFRAVSQGRLIYERNYITTCDYIEKVIGLYQDYAIILEAYYKEYDQALREAYQVGR